MEDVICALIEVIGTLAAECDSLGGCLIVLLIGAVITGLAYGAYFMLR